MDVLGLVLALPAVVIANIVYVVIARFGLIRFRTLRPWLLWVSWVMVGLAVIDVLVVATVGPVAARTQIGPAFWRLHLLVFVFGAPSLANVLILPQRGMWYRYWLATAAICCLVGVFLVFFQTAVGGALYGPDGVGGPFSDR